MATAIRIAELRLAIFIAEHVAFSVADHLTESLSITFSVSRVAGGTPMHRTKCPALATNAVGPSLDDGLV